MVQTNIVHNELYTLEIVGSLEELWRYRLIPSGETYGIRPPEFEIDGKSCRTALKSIVQVDEPRCLRNGVTEYRFLGVLQQDVDLSMELIFRVAPGNPVLRFAYRLFAANPKYLTRNGGRDCLHYGSVGLERYEQFREIRLSDFNEYNHHYDLTETPVETERRDNHALYAGPITVASNSGFAAMMAYEHGSPSIDLYVGYQLDREKELTLRAVKGNYDHRHPLDGESGFRTIWMQFGALPGSEQDLAIAYRVFVLRYFSESSLSRRPYIFYNTWNFQERNRYWYGKRYFDSIHLARILEEIDAAHRMGIEVYVIDNGWFTRTGDWDVDLDRFPDGLKLVKERLDRYGMKLGLWFDPKAVALTSGLYTQYEHCIVSWDGEREAPHPIWESEDSVRMCLVSPYAQAFADKLIELSKKLGVVYFKWDAISQYGCNDPNHDHGDERHSPEERGHRFSFELCLKLTEIARRVTEAVPEAIVDFDVTEDYRCFGLSFLEAGKYFLINNGPYFPNFDIPRSDPSDAYNFNVFFYPGAARSLMCRKSLTYDRWIPSVLFLAHYLPDDPGTNQNISAASLMLGHNGIWGDLPAISDDGVARWARLLGMYKQVREDIAESYPIVEGGAGFNPEIYEKINGASGRGAVILFANSFGRPFDKARKVTHTYITRHTVDPNVWYPPNVSVRFDAAGRAVIKAEFHEADAVIVFFGISTAVT